MTRLEITQRFRDECPEITENVVSSVTLNTWCLEGDKEICAKARLIVDSGVIVAVTSRNYYDLTALSKFFDIDENPGGGITRVDSDGNERRLIKTTKAELDFNRSSWRTASSGTPKYFYRRGKYAFIYPPPDSSIEQFNIDFVCVSDDFNSDNVKPFNQLTYLEPFHSAVVFYLIWRAKAKVAKPEDAASALNIYNAYVQWMRKEIGGGKYGAINLVPSGLPFMGGQR